MKNEGRSKVEVVKDESNQLRGTITEALGDGTAKFSEENIQVLKFHGTYQQDDRDLRKQLRKEGKDRHYMMMIRARVPGGILTADQYLNFDRLSEVYGNQTMRVTTRQTFQLHGILKGDLKETIRSINDTLVTTLGGCGDQVRNIVGCAQPHQGPFYDAVRCDLLALVDALSAKTNAYHEIWLDGEKVQFTEDKPKSELATASAEEPLYGKTYLPRKFKLAFAYEGDNCADIYSNDIGFVAHRDGADRDEVVGYTLVIGGGMGRTASDANTHPLLASPFAFVGRDELVDVCRAIVTVQRDHGNRTDRKFARMKYLVEEKGVTWFRDQVESRIGHALEPPRKLVWKSTADHLGWHREEAHVRSVHTHDEQGTGYLGIYVENGRIHDIPGMALKTVLREIMEVYQPEVHLTTQQNVILAHLTPSQRDEIVVRLRAAGVSLVEQVTKVRQGSMACPAMPTCGLAIAESERALPSVLPQFEQIMHDLGLADQEISIRMTGCANGCARPYLAEIGFVGRVIGQYDVYLGASESGTRMNERFAERVALEDLAELLRPILTAFKDERQGQERFGDYCYRVGFDQLREQVRHVTA